MCLLFLALLLLFEAVVKVSGLGLDLYLEEAFLNSISKKVCIPNKCVYRIKTSCHLTGPSVVSP